MNRSAGVTISAIAVMLGSGLALLMGMMMLIASSGGIPVPENQAQFMKYFMILMAVVFFSAGAWGISTGMGLLRVREWSRISMLVFSALMLFICIPGLLMFLTMPFPPPGTAPSPQLTKNVLMGTKIFLTLFYAFLAVLGGWWLYFFNKRSTKEQFLKVPGGSSDRILAEAMIAQGARPLSITLIAWYLLISAFIGVLGLSVNPPVFFLGFFFKGTFASLIMFGLAIVQSLTVVLIPGTQGRFDQAMADMVRDMQVGSSAAPPHFPVWFGVIFAIPLLALLLWIVISKKEAFHA